jgi:Tol biopolymer transport system component
MSSVIRGAAVVALLALLSAPLHAQVLRQLTDGACGNYWGYAIDDAGGVVFQVRSSDPDGVNPDRLFQIFRFTLPGAVVAQVGSFAQGIAVDTVSVTDDGSEVVLISPSDPLGSNHDRSLELFLMGSDGSGLVQLTNDPAVNAGSVLDAKISGSGNRVAFIANTDPLGTNPDRLAQLFVVDTSTLVVTQVTTASTGEFEGFAISDDGDRVLFSHDGDPIPNSVVNGTPELYTFVVSISLRKQATFTSDVREPVLSGNGETIAFNGTDGVTVRGWFDGTELVIGSGFDLTISDDGAWVYYVWEDTNENWEIFVADTAGVGIPVPITQTSPGNSNLEPIVSGDNSRIVFRTSGGELGWGTVVMDVDGTNVEELNVVSSSECRDGGGSPVITPDGSLILYSWGGLRTMQSDGSDVTEVTSTFLGSYNETVSGDGGTIVFESSYDLTGQNPDTERQTFKIHSDGTGLAQLSPGDCESLQPSVSADASVITTFSTCDWTGENPGHDPELFSVPLDGGTPVQITDDADGNWKIPRISENGEWVAYESLGQVYRARVDGTAIEQITFETDGGYYRVDISADGTRVAYASNTDPVGTNSDRNWEIFVFDASTSVTRQLTVTATGSSFDPVMSGDGEYVYFMSDAQFFESVPTVAMEYYRVAVESAVVERVGGLREPRSRLDNQNQRYFPVTTVAHSGDLAVYSGITNPTGENNDLGHDVWLVDFTTPAKIRPGKATPTVVTWDVEPSPVRYDVIRGDVAGLQTGPANTVDLGAVVCLEDDSPDATTAGFEDPDEPAPGQAFFFLYRGSQGIDDGPGTWGQGTGVAERVAGAGSCLP